MATALITGASGFLGREVVQFLVEQDPELELVALLRARDDRDLEARRLRLVDPLPEAARRRVSAIRGDVAEPHLGLGSDGMARLAARADRVVHVAATTSFDHPLDEARRINVGGTEQAIALCRAIRARGGSGRLDYVGTAYVAGDRTDLAREQELDVGQGFRNTYERSKLEAEKLVRAAQDDLPAAILRPSIIVGDSRTGRTTSYKTIYWPMKVLFAFYGLSRPIIPRIVRLPVKPDCTLDVVPVDWVAQSVARLFADESAAGGCFHLAAGPAAATIEQLVNLCCDHFGVARIGYLDPDGPIRLVARALRPLLMRVRPRLVGNGELMLAYTRKNPRFDVSAATAKGLIAPPVDGYFQRLVGFAYGADFGRGEALAQPRSMDPMRVVLALGLLLAIDGARADTVVPGDKKARPPVGDKRDRDGDGVPDSLDKCPDQPEDRDGFQDEDGCPDPDNDGDGIPDVDDLCPNEPEDRDGFEDEDGCPDPDNDHDRIPDAVDKCPNEPETWNGIEDDDGCPDKCTLRIEKCSITIVDKLYFAENGARIPKAALPLLDAVAATLKGNPQLTRIEIQGHGERREATSVSQARALAVQRYLVDHGLDAGRLVARGYGATRPINRGLSDGEREKNRRVEFVILERGDE